MLITDDINIMIIYGIILIKGCNNKYLIIIYDKYPFIIKVAAEKMNSNKKHIFIR